MSTEEDTGGGLVRPKDAAISCSHLWAYLLLVSGLAGFLMGAIIFSEWKGIGSFWVGAMAIAAGISGIYVTQAEAHGGIATGFYFFLSLVTFASSLASLILGEGAGEHKRTVKQEDQGGTSSAVVTINSRKMTDGNYMLVRCKVVLTCEISHEMFPWICASMGAYGVVNAFWSGSTRLEPYDP